MAEPTPPPSAFSRRSDGSQPPLVLEDEATPPAAASAAPAASSPLRKPAPASATTKEILASRSQSGGAPAPDETLMAALQAKMGQKYGIRPDDPIYALIEILKAHEGEMKKIGVRNDAIAKESAATISKAIADYKQVMQEGSSLTEAMAELSANLSEANVSTGMLDEHVGRIRKIGEHITQTGHMDRLLKLLSPAIAAVVAVIVGLIAGFLLSRL